MPHVPAPSQRTQLYAVRLLTDWTLREIGELFAGNDLTATSDTLDEDRWPIGTSERRDLAARYHAALDLSSPVARARLLRVYDEILSKLEDPTEFRAHLKRDGVVFEAEGSIAPVMMRVPVTPIALAMDLSAAQWEAGAFRLFVSHTSGHRERAARLRGIFAEWGVDAFVAHDTIEPTREWQSVIEAALMTCDALCALLTADFLGSRWCDQEVGFAMARGALVVPLKVDADPHGFIGKYQAVSATEGTAREVAGRLFTALAKSPSNANRMAPAIVRRYENSKSYANTEAAFLLMQGILRGAWTPAMVEQVERAAIDNPQVRDARLQDGRPIADAASDLLRGIRGASESATRLDDDIPF